MEDILNFDCLGCAVADDAVEPPALKDEDKEMLEEDGEDVRLDLV